jgi:hypothetical protein
MGRNNVSCSERRAKQDLHGVFAFGAQAMLTNGNQAAARVIEAFEKLGVEYLLAGSFSSNFYGIPRSLKDADFVAVLGAGVAALEKELEADFVLDPQPSFKTVTGTYREKLKARDIPFEIELFHLSPTLTINQDFTGRGGWLTI